LQVNCNAWLGRTLVCAIDRTINHYRCEHAGHCEENHRQEARDRQQAIFDNDSKSDQSNGDRKPEQAA
jgi:hypothetical protein